MKSKINKSAIWAMLLALVLSAFILAAYSTMELPAADTIARKLANAVSSLIYLTKSLNLSRCYYHVRNICLVAFLLLLTFWRFLLIRRNRFWSL
ncbi:MAG: hypothetical protein JSV82_08780 [Planctomycetota bacterium]|nr:MAG: hypothetical protein JSV82_08780 [Planctomycetota bacterium]